MKEEKDHMQVPTILELNRLIPIPIALIPYLTWHFLVKQQSVGRLHRQGARLADREQEVGAEEGDRRGGAGEVQVEDLHQDQFSVHLLVQVKEVKNVQSMYQKEREDLKKAIEEMQKKFNQLKVSCILHSNLKIERSDNKKHVI